MPRFPAESLAIYAEPFGKVIEPVKSGTSPFAARFVTELKSRKTLREVIERLSPTQEKSLDSLAVLDQPASRAAFPAGELKAGKTAGEEVSFA